MRLKDWLFERKGGRLDACEGKRHECPFRSAPISRIRRD
jgi:hypothetical protein